MSIGVFLLDDHEQVRNGLRRLIEISEDLIVVGESGTVAEALPLILKTRPDVAILDVRLPDGTGIEVGRDVRSTCPEVRCLLLTGYAADEALVAATMAGAAGYISKPISANDLRLAIRRVAAGEPVSDPELMSRVIGQLALESSDPRLAGLATEERHILDLVAKGQTNGQIGDQLDLPEASVKLHIAQLLTALGID